MSNAAVERVTIVGESEGIEELAADLNKVADAQENVAKASKATEAVVERSARSVAGAAKANERLARTLDDGYARAQDYARGVATLNRGLDQGVLDASTYANRMELLGNKFGVVNDNLRLTGNQVKNLGFQINDAGTMIASGSSVFQVLATQSGQVIQALGDGPGGVRGSLAAIGSAVVGFVRGLGPAGLALGGVAAAATGFALIVNRDVKPIEDIIKRQDDAIRNLRDAYGIAGDAAEEYARRSPKAVQLGAKDNYEADLKRAREEVANRISDQFSGRDNFRFRTQAQFDEARKAFLMLKKSAEEGPPAFAEFEAALAQIDPSKATAEAVAFAKANREWAQGLIELQSKLMGVNALMSDSAVRALEMKKAFGAAMTGLAGLVPDLRTQAERVNDFFAEAVKNGQAAGDEMVALYQRQRAMQPITDTANAALREEQSKRAAIGLGKEAAAVAEVNARYESLKAGVKGNTEAIAAYEAAQREAIAAVKDQTAFDATQEAAKKTEQANAKAEAQAKAAAEATRARLSGIDATVRGLQTEAETLGMSEGAAAGYRFQVEALAAAKAAAGASGVVSDAELQKINEASAAIARMTDNLAARREADAAIGQFYPLEKAAQEAERLQAMVSDASNGLTDLQRKALSLKIDKGFVDAKEAAERLRGGGVSAAQDIGKAFITNVGDVFADIFSSATKDGESFFASILRGFAGLGSQLAAAGAKNLFGSLFGISQDKAAAGVGGVGGFGGVPSSSGGGRVGAIASAPLTALNDNLVKTSRSALDVAKQFDGLNERADSTVLDGFLRASGNWKGLSSANTAWCAAFANASIMSAGGKGTGSNMASSFLQWGLSTSAPKKGDIVVLRPQAAGTSGHVGFFEGFTDRGGVRVFSGNSGNAARSSVYDQRSVREFRTAGNDNAIPSDSVLAASQRQLQRSVETGTARGVEQASQKLKPGFLYTNAQGETTNHVGLTRTQQGLGVVGAGLGIFGQGYQSGSPLSGGLSGAMGGWQAAGALGIAGPIGAIGGAALGILGGILGGRAQRKQEHQQKAAEWEAQRPAYEAFKRSLTGKTGTLREQFGGEWSQFQSFVATGSKAWKMGKGNSTAEFDSTGLLIMNRAIKAMGDFRASFGELLEDVKRGLGSNSPFAKGTEAIKTLRTNYLSALDDVEVAFGKADNGLPMTGELLAWEKQLEDERNRAVAAFKGASIANALGLLDIAEPLSDAAQAVEGFKGIAKGMPSVLVEMGTAAAEAAAEVDQRFTRVMGKLRATFEQGVSDRLLDLQGKGYVVETRDMLKEFAGLQADAALLGADQSSFGELLRLQAQKIVDGAELTGEAFNELVRLFPVLGGVVKEFAAETLAASASEIADAIKGYEDRLADARAAGDELAAFERRAAKERVDAARFGASALASLEVTLAAERLAIVLSRARTALDQSYQAETDRINDLISTYRDQANELENTIDGLKNFADQIADFRKSLVLDDSLSTLAPDARLEEARKQFLDLAARAETDEDARSKLTGAGQEYLTELRSFWASNERYNEGFNEVQRILAKAEGSARSQLSTAESQLSSLKQQISQNETLLETNRKSYEALLGINEGVKSLAAAMKDYAAAAAVARDKGITVPGSGSGSGGGGTSTPTWGTGSAGGYLAKNADVAAAIRAGETFGLPAGMAPEVYASAHYGLYGQGEGRGFARGGYTGNGAIGAVAGVVHGQEFVAHADATRRWRPQLEAMNAGIFSEGDGARASSGPSEADLSELREAIGVLGDRITSAIAGDGQETRSVLSEGNTTLQRLKAVLDAA